MSLEALWYGRAPKWQRALYALPAAPLSWLYGLGVGARNLAWNTGLLTPTRVEGLTVVSVGNLVAGGAGKTPVVMFLAQWAQACGRRVAVLTRGYGRRGQAVRRFSGAALPPCDEVGDEPRLIARRCPSVEVWVGADRVALALEARAAGATFAVLDDGFQHRRLHRELDLLVEPADPAEHLLPWGPLREPRSGAGRAQVLWSAQRRPGGVEAGTRATALCDGAATHPLEWLQGKRVLALAGIARPWRFADTLAGCGAQVVDRAFFGDHHAWSQAELVDVAARAQRAGAVLVTTEKDRERLPAEFAAPALRIDAAVHSGLEHLAAPLGLDPAKAGR